MIPETMRGNYVLHDLLKGLAIAYLIWAQWLVPYLLYQWFEQTWLWESITASFKEVMRRGRVEVDHKTGVVTVIGKVPVKVYNQAMIEVSNARITQNLVIRGTNIQAIPRLAGS